MPPIGGTVRLFLVGNVVKKKPDLMLVLLAVFGLGVLATLLMPLSSSNSVAKPLSPQQAGVFVQTVSSND